MNRWRPPASQRGVALIVALLAVALAVLLATALIDGGELGRARLRNQWRAAQSAELMRGLEDWAAQVLLADQRLSPDLDTLDDPWAQPAPPIVIPGAVINGRLRDLGGCFNLNSLAPAGVSDPEAVARLQRLLVGLRLDPRIAAQAADWRDRDREPQDGGAEDSAYATLGPPGRAANRAFVDASELKRLPLVDAAAWAVLSPYVCALPESARLNLNTAPALLWLSLAEGMDIGQARRLAREPGTAYRSLDAVRESLAREGIGNVDLSPYSLATDYFRVEARIDADGIVFDYSSVLAREPGRVRVLARVRGRL